MRMMYNKDVNRMPTKMAVFNKKKYFESQKFGTQLEFEQ